MKTYSYKECLDAAYRVNWRIDEVLGEQKFDFSKRWLPRRLSAADFIECLNDDEKLKLTHVEMGSYAHIFEYVEEFIAPQMTHLAQNQENTDREVFEALANFVAEEVKHMTLFRRIRERVDGQLGFKLKLLDGEKEVTNYVLGKNTGAVLLLVACIEWFTQLHYITSIREDTGLDELTKKIFRAHWLEEAQHAKMDHMEALRAFSTMSDEQKEQAVSDLIELVKAVDGLLQKQANYDVENLSLYLKREFSQKEWEEIYHEELKIKRWVFLTSGLTHPRFLELFNYVTTPKQRERIQVALAA